MPGEPRRTRRPWAILGLLMIAPALAAGQDVEPQGPPKALAPPPAPTMEVKLRRADASAAADLLRPPGDRDRYGPKIDWRTVPPWNQTEFFGIRARGKVFIYVVDCSGSMADDLRLYRAKAEIRRSVAALRWPQRFHVLFYNDGVLTMPGGLPAPADPTNKAQLVDWLSQVQAEGPTDPRAAMTQALSLQPDAIFLLSDGQFPAGTADQIAGKNPEKVPVHCIDLSGGAAGNQLRQIARDSGGEYRARP